MMPKFVSEQLTLGELIDVLKDCGSSAEVRFGFGYLAPTSIGSYRGYYDHLSLRWADGYTVTVGDLLKTLDDALGRTFSGYKGGNYRATRETPVWVDNAADASGTAVIGVEDYSNYVVILTKHMET